MTRFFFSSLSGILGYWESFIKFFSTGFSPRSLCIYVRFPAVADGRWLFKPAKFSPLTVFSLLSLSWSIFFSNSFSFSSFNLRSCSSNHLASASLRASRFLASSSCCLASSSFLCLSCSLSNSSCFSLYNQLGNQMEKNSNHGLIFNSLC